MKKQEYLVTLINLHIYNQPFITSELAIKMLIIFLFFNNIYLYINKEKKSNVCIHLFHINLLVKLHAYKL